MLLFKLKKNKFILFFLLFLVLFSFPTKNINADWVYVYSFREPDGPTITSPEFTEEGICVENQEKTDMLYSSVYNQSGLVTKCRKQVKLNETELLKLKNEMGKQTIDTDTNYTLLEPLPDGSGGSFTSFESNPTKNSCPFGKYLNILIKLAIGICSVLAVLMIVKGGVQYMMGELPSEKSSGRSTITNAVLGLIVALGAYLILYTVNPNLLNFCLDQQLPETVIIVNGESSLNPEPIKKIDLEKITGIYCPGEGGEGKLAEISRSFMGRVTYNQNKRNTTDGTTAYFDCSSFVSQIYSCAGLQSPGNTTAEMFNSTNASTNLTNLKMGDLLGWKQGENNEKSGHVFMYLMGDTIIEVSNPPGGINKNAHLNSLSKYKKRIKYVIRL